MKTEPSAFAFPLPVPDVAHTIAPLLPAPAPADAGVCFCCRATVRHRFILEEGLPLAGLVREAENAATRLARAEETAARLEERPEPEGENERQKYARALRDARTALAQARLAARRLILRHIPLAEVTDTGPLTEAETAAGQLEMASGSFALCAFCHAWHALNGFAAAQGAMVWLPDLYPATVVALNRRALQGIFSDSRDRRREGREVLSMLMQSRLAVEDRYRTFRPADFADVLTRHSPAQRDELRHKMTGLALVLTPDSFPEPDDVY